jgi:hypothetical protein
MNNILFRREEDPSVRGVLLSLLLYSCSSSSSPLAALTPLVTSTCQEEAVQTAMTMEWEEEHQNVMESVTLRCLAKSVPAPTVSAIIVNDKGDEDAHTSKCILYSGSSLLLRCLKMQSGASKTKTTSLVSQVCS